MIKSIHFQGHIFETNIPPYVKNSYNFVCKKCDYSIKVHHSYEGLNDYDLWWDKIYAYLSDDQSELIFINGNNQAVSIDPCPLSEDDFIAKQIIK